MDKWLERISILQDELLLDMDVLESPDSELQNKTKDLKIKIDAKRNELNALNLLIDRQDSIILTDCKW